MPLVKGGSGGGVVGSGGGCSSSLGDYEILQQCGAGTYGYVLLSFFHSFILSLFGNDVCFEYFVLILIWELG